MGGNIFDLGLDIKVDAAGNVYTTGYFAGFNIDFNPGVGVFNLSSSMSVEDVFILKLDTNGNFVWARNMGGVGYDRAYSIAVDASGNVYTTGIFDKTGDFDPGAGTFNLVSNLNTVGSNDIFVSKLNSLGNFVWAKKFGGSGNDLGMAIAVDATNNVYIAGYFADRVSFNSSLPTLVGVGGVNSSNNMFLAKLDGNNGGCLWARNMGYAMVGAGSFTNNGISIALDATGNIYILHEII